MAANKNMVNYAKFIAVPTEKIPAGEHNAYPRVLLDKYTMAATLDINDVLYGQIIPAGAKITKVELSTSKALGTTGILSVGLHPVGGTIAPASLIAATDCHAAAQRLNMSAGVAYPELTVDSNIVIKCTEASTATDAVIEILVEYVLA
jgi:hypothetical protein